MNVYEVVTERIVEALSKGVVPWRKPWSSLMPRNLVSGKEYRGVNILLLQSTPFLSPYWLTYRQAKALGGTVKRGVRGCPVVFFARREAEERDGRTRECFILRYFTAFNLEQTEGIEAPALAQPTHFNPIEKCEQVLATYKSPPRIEHGGSQACYFPAHDRVQLPPRGAFDRSEDYYATLFHELAHSSGASHRLGRKGVVDAARFASHAYSVEELVAEIGAAFLCAHTGISPLTFDQSTSYIWFWTSKLRLEPRMIVEASSQAAKAVDLILGRAAEKVETTEEAA